MPQKDIPTQPREKTPEQRTSHIDQHQRTFARLAYGGSPSEVLLKHGTLQLKGLEEDYLDGTIAEAVGHGQVGQYLSAVLLTLGVSTMGALDHIAICPNCGPKFVDRAEDFIAEFNRVWDAYVEPLTGTTSIFSDPRSPASRH